MVSSKMFPYIFLQITFFIWTIIRMEIVASETFNCLYRNNSQPNYSYPNVRVSRYYSPTANSSDSQLNNRIPLTLQYLELECNALYPVKFGFERYPYVPWDTETERRVTNSTSTEEFVTKLKFYSFRAFDLENRYPTCYNQRHRCLQTTLTSITQDNSSNAIQLTFLEGSDLQMKPRDLYNNNGNCAIKFAYDKQTERFYCYTNTGEIPEIIFQSCSDPISCIALTVKTNCSIEPEISISDCTEKKFCRVASMMVDYLPAVATCVTSGNVLNTVTLHYFYSLPRKNIFSSRYFNWNEAPPEDMIEISDLAKATVYSGEMIHISCNASYYYFASGLKIRIQGESNNFLKDLFHVDKVIRIPSTSHGTQTTLALNRSVLLTEPIWEPGEYSITCSAPVLNSTEWISKSTRITVLCSEKPNIIGGNGTVSMNYEPSMEIVCNASGVPKPVFSWQWNRDQMISSSPLHFNISDGGNASYSWSRLHLPNWEIGILQNVTCIAKNVIGYAAKDFLLVSIEKEEMMSPFIFVAIGTLVILVVVIVGFVWRIREDTKRRKYYLTPKEYEDFMNGKLEEFVKISSSDPARMMNDIIDYMPYNKDRLEIPRERIIIDRGTVLGVGAYGVVLKAEQLSSEFPHSVIRVAAVKSLKKDYNPNRDGTKLKILLSELKTLSYIGDHPRIVNLIGAVTTGLMKGKLYMVLELCENGSIFDYIRGNKQIFYNPCQSNSDSSGTQSEQGYDNLAFEDYGNSDACRKSRTFSRLMAWALQIAEAMTFLASKKVVHSDLAARNVLLTKTLEVKIADFGLSNRLNDSKSYARASKIPLPHKWLAIECLQTFKCYLESDIWSFGITLWEILSLCEIPYTGTKMESMSQQEFLKALQVGERLSQPPLATSQIYDLMKKCWLEDRKCRPEFLSIKIFIAQCLAQEKQTRSATLSQSRENFGRKGLLNYCSLEFESDIESCSNKNSDTPSCLSKNASNDNCKGAQSCTT